jgi:hypothetical protein
MAVCRYHFDSGPSVTAVLIVVDNGKLSQVKKTMDCAFIGHSVRDDGDLKTVVPTNPAKAISYQNVHFVPLYHGDLYVFPGFAVRHGVCNPQLSPTGHAHDHYKKAYKTVSTPHTHSHEFTSHFRRRKRL